MQITQAGLIEECSEHVEIRYCHWLMDHPEATEEQIQVVADFVKYCTEKDQEDLRVPRANGKSFLEWREQGIG